MITAFCIYELKCDLYFVIPTEYTTSLSDWIMVNLPIPFWLDLKFL